MSWSHVHVAMLLCMVMPVGALAEAEKQSGRIQTLAGTGSGADGGAGGDALQTNLFQPFGLQIGPDGALYFCEYGSHRVRRLDLVTNQLANVAGTGRAGYSGDGGPAVQAQLNRPHELRIDSDGNIYVTDMSNQVVRRVDGKTGIISTLAGTGRAGFSGDGGPAQQAQLNNPASIALDHRGSLFIADVGNHRIRRVDLASGTIETVAGTGEPQMPPDGAQADSSPLRGPRSLATHGQALWFTLREGHSIWRLDLDDNTLHHVAGTGQPGFAQESGDAKAARLDSPKGIAVGPDGIVYVADSSNHLIRRINPQDGTISIVAGRPREPGFGGDGAAATARLNNPHGIFCSADGTLFVGDSDNHRVRVIRPAGAQ